MMMMMTLMVKQVQLFFKLWILCHLSIGLNASFARGDGGGGQDDEDETLMVKQVNSLNCSSNYGFFVQTCSVKFLFLRCG